jgi:hypothetical protein
VDATKPNTTATSGGGGNNRGAKCLDWFKIKYSISASAQYGITKFNLLLNMIQFSCNAKLRYFSGTVFRIAHFPTSHNPTL